MIAGNRTASRRQRRPSRRSVVGSIMSVAMVVTPSQ